MAVAVSQRPEVGTDWDNIWAVVEVYAGLPEKVWVTWSEKRATEVALEIAEEGGFEWDDDGYWRRGDTELQIRPALLEPPEA